MAGARTRKQKGRGKGASTRSPSPSYLSEAPADVAPTHPQTPVEICHPQSTVHRMLCVCFGICPGDVKTHTHSHVFGVLCCSMTPGLSKRTFAVMYNHTLLYACKPPDQTSGHCNVGCQPGDCSLPVNLFSGVWVNMYGLAYSLCHPRQYIHCDHRI